MFDDALPPVEEVPAAHLAGRDLGNGWIVGERISRSPTATGSCFSIGYLARHKESGQVAFLKALDFSAAFQGGDVIAELQRFTSAYDFEREVVQACADHRLSRVITLIAHGQITVQEAGPFGTVPYLIFEYADGDVRRFCSSQDRLDLVWLLLALKHAAQGIEQLHGVDIAHQDLKPSNLLTQASGREMKLGDLGRAERRHASGPYAEHMIPGAYRYAPPEQLYGTFGHTWEERRAADLYLLGSLAVNLVLGHSLTALVYLRLPEAFHHQCCEHLRDALPHWQAAHLQVIDDVRRALEAGSGDQQFAAEFAQCVAQMTEPDPVRRGHPADRAQMGSSYSVRRFISIFDRLQSHAMAAALRSKDAAAP